MSTTPCIAERRYQIETSLPLPNIKRPGHQAAPTTTDLGTRRLANRTESTSPWGPKTLEQPKGMIWPESLARHHAEPTRPWGPKPLEQPKGMIWPEGLARHHGVAYPAWAQRGLALKKCLIVSDPPNAHLAAIPWPKASQVPLTPRKRWADSTPLRPHPLSAALSNLSKPVTGQLWHPVERLPCQRPAIEKPLASALTRQPIRLPTPPTTLTPPSKNPAGLYERLVTVLGKQATKEQALDALLTGLLQISDHTVAEHAQWGKARRRADAHAQIKTLLTPLTTHQTQRLLGLLNNGLAKSVHAIAQAASSPAAKDAQDPRKLERLARLAETSYGVDSLIRHLNARLGISNAGMSAPPLASARNARLSQPLQRALERATA